MILHLSKKINNKIILSLTTTTYNQKPKTQLTTPKNKNNLLQKKKHKKSGVLIHSSPYPPSPTSSESTLFPTATNVPPHTNYPGKNSISVSVVRRGQLQWWC
jgi:hypothetical protein